MGSVLIPAVLGGRFGYLVSEFGTADQPICVGICNGQNRPGAVTHTPASASALATSKLEWRGSEIAPQALQQRDHHILRPCVRATFAADTSSAWESEPVDVPGKAQPPGGSFPNPGQGVLQPRL